MKVLTEGKGKNGGRGLKGLRGKLEYGDLGGIPHRGGEKAERSLMNPLRAGGALGYYQRKLFVGISEQERNNTKKKDKTSPQHRERFRQSS